VVICPLHGAEQLGKGGPGLGGGRPENDDCWDESPMDYGLRISRRVSSSLYALLLNSVVCHQSMRCGVPQVASIHLRCMVWDRGAKLTLGRKLGAHPFHERVVSIDYASCIPEPEYLR